jgi:hypothetical protein
MLKVRHCNAVVIIGLAALTAACDKAQLLAPTESTITVSAPTRVLPSNGTTPITAAVLEQAGTPVQNGTTVRFTTTLGRVDPVEVQTTNGLAITTFFAGANSGVAEIRATSGAATGGTGATATNVVTITIGAAAVNTVTVRASPGSVGPNGGTVTLIANVVGENGQPLSGVLVTFNTDQGSLGSATVVTDANGEARTTLTTSQKATITATAGIKTSTPATVVDLRAGPIVTITCAPASGTGNCAAIQASTSDNTATVIFTVTRPTGSSALRSAVIDFGDGTTQALGNLAGGTATVTHTYSGPTGSTARPFTATVLATDINGESQSASTTVIVTPRATPTPLSVRLTAAKEAATSNGQRWTFTATVTGGGEGTTNVPVESYRWNFGDGTEEVTTSSNEVVHIYNNDNINDPQQRTVTVTVRTQDGRTAVGRTEILVDPRP